MCQEKAPGEENAEENDRPTTVIAVNLYEPATVLAYTADVFACLRKDSKPMLISLEAQINDIKRQVATFS